ncbi:Hypp4585 [Branchiostoma lanceolatum]|uniref:Hypp4585 protein n=1 Tax=Branchiostoma lanceolatum TaxID=7740 RepID=A0A8K0EW87_BRALA|nr:Hypp4585 [Branchiostoma lanceolatum]
MADDLAANPVPSVTAADGLPTGKTMHTNKNLETVESIFKPPDGDDNIDYVEPCDIGYQDDPNRPEIRDGSPNIQPYAFGYKNGDDDQDDDDDANKSTKFDAAAANEQTTQPSSILPQNQVNHNPIYPQNGGYKKDQDADDDDDDAKKSTKFDAAAANEQSTQLSSIFPQNEENPNPIYPQGYRNDDNDDANESTKVDATTANEQSTIDRPFYQQNIGNSDLMVNSNVPPEPTSWPAASNPCIQPCALKYQEEDNDNNTQTEHSATTLVEETTQLSPTNGDIEPYAVAYICQDDMSASTAKESSQQMKPVSNSIDDNPNNMTGRDSSIDDTGTSGLTEDDSNIRRLRRSLTALDPNPVYTQDALVPNKMYVPNVHPQTANTLPVGGKTANPGRGYTGWQRGRPGEVRSASGVGRLLPPMTTP